MRKFGLLAVLAVALMASARADVVTNVWIAPNGAKTRILAVRGHAAPRPPRALYDFTRFLRGADGSGYWIKTE